MTLSDLLSTEVGAALAFALTWGVAAWGYHKNKGEHEGLGDKVDVAKDEILKKIDKLSDRIDGVREAISQHETHWHAPIVRKPTRIKRAAKKR